VTGHRGGVDGDGQRGVGEQTQHTAGVQPLQHRLGRVARLEAVAGPTPPASVQPATLVHPAAAGAGRDTATTNASSTAVCAAAT
jgi:hypothetical protein